MSGDIKYRLRKRLVVTAFQTISVEEFEAALEGKSTKDDNDWVVFIGGVDIDMTNKNFRKLFVEVTDD